MAKRPKNGQKAKPFFFWQTVSKRPNSNPALDNGVMELLAMASIFFVYNKQF